jgi:hypothetical protein
MNLLIEREENIMEKIRCSDVLEEMKNKEKKRWGYEKR